MTLVPPSSKYGNSGYVLGADATGWSHTGDTADTKLVSVAIPANTIGVGGTVEIITLWSYPNSANNKTLRARLGAANDLTGTSFLSATQTTSVGYQAWTGIRNRLTNSQVGLGAATGGTFGATGTALTPASIDTTAQTFVVFSAQLASAAETITLESYLVRVVPGV